MITTREIQELKPREAIDELRSLLHSLEKGGITVQDFTPKVKELLTQHLSLYPHLAEMRDREVDLHDEMAEFWGIFPLVACAIDVARQAEAISQVDDLIIYPLSHEIPPVERGKDLLLGYASETLSWAFRYMLKKRICFEPGGKWDKQAGGAV